MPSARELAEKPFSLNTVLHLDGAPRYFQDNGFPLIDSRQYFQHRRFRVDVTARKLDEEKIRHMNSELERRVSGTDG